MKGGHKVIAYASRQLLKHEKNYTPFLIKMQAIVWAMEHFDTYLRGRKFKVFSDPKPLEAHGKRHEKHSVDYKKPIKNGTLKLSTKKDQKCQLIS